MAVVESYSYGHSRPKSAKLAGLKFQLYDRSLPTLRKMDRDDVLQRLPYEHSRTSREFLHSPRSLHDQLSSSPPTHTVVFTTARRCGIMTSIADGLARLAHQPKPPIKRYTEDWRSVLAAVTTARKPLDITNSPVDMPFKITSTHTRRPMAATM